MADNNNTELTTQEGVTGQTGDETPSTSAERERESSPDAPKKSGSGNGLLWVFTLFIFVLVLAGAAAAYWYLTQRMDNTSELEQAQQTYTTKLATLNQQNSQLQQRLSELESSRESLNSEMAALESTTRELGQQTQSLVKQLKNQEGHRPADWLIAEADYLVKMAGRKLWLEQDVRTAIMLLENADKRLESLGDPSVLPVRAKLAGDIQTLRQLNPVSKTSVALALSGMLTQVDTLPLHVFEKPEAANEDAKLTSSAADWKQNLAKVWHSLVDDFFEIKSLSEPVAPVMTQQQRWLVREQMKLQLMQAQSAALNGEAKLYEQSLKNAQTLLDDKFARDNAQISGFGSALDNLQQTDISQPIPTELSVQQALETLLDQRVKEAFGEGATAL